MIELIQFPWSPFCIVQRRILEYSGTPFKITNVPNGDRSYVWKVTRGRYYDVPVIRDGRMVVFEVSEDSQVIAKYLDEKLHLGLFPRQWEGLQNILWRYLENDVEGFTFRLNDIYYKEMVPKSDELLFLRHKERKFGRGCIDLWRNQQKAFLKELKLKLIPCEQMLATRPFLLDLQPRFVDFNLFGMLGNFLYSGHYQIPPSLKNLHKWYRKMETATHASFDT